MYLSFRLALISIIFEKYSSTRGRKRPKAEKWIAHQTTFRGPLFFYWACFQPRTVYQPIKQWSSSTLLVLYSSHMFFFSHFLTKSQFMFKTVHCMRFKSRLWIWQFQFPFMYWSGKGQGYFHWSRARDNRFHVRVSLQVYSNTLCLDFFI